MSCRVSKHGVAKLDYQHTIGLSKNWSSLSLGLRSRAALESIHIFDCFGGSGSGNCWSREGLDSLEQIRHGHYKHT